MKNLFKINEDEKSRILFLHENFGKKEILTEADMTDNDLLGSTNVLRNYIQLVSDFDVLYGPLGINAANALGGRRAGVKGVVDALDGFVDAKDLAYVLKVISGLKGKCYLDDSKVPAVRISAMKRFLELYKEDEGEDLIADVQSVGTSTLPTGSEKVKTQIINTIKSYSATNCSAAAGGGGLSEAAMACVKQFNGTEAKPAKTPGFVYVTASDKSTVFFSKDYEVRYRPVGGEIIKGQWSCKGNVLKITTVDGDSYTNGKWAGVSGSKTGGKTGGKTGDKTSSTLAPRVQAVQKSLGIQNGTGQLDVASLQTMLTKLNSGTPAAGAPAQSVGTPTAAGVVSQPAQPGAMTTDQLNNTIKQLAANANRPI